MRCPKCKFISFDDLSNCAKCANDLSGLAAELNGTCKETHLEFFLGPVVQVYNSDEKVFSDSQALPPINPDDIDFDDTSSGQFSALARKGGQAQGLDFDEGAEVDREDDISIELGDIMPIDLDQLDLTSVSSEAVPEMHSSENEQEDSSEKTIGLENDIDLNLTDEFANDNLDLELNEGFSDIELDDTALAAGDDTTVIHTSSASAPDDTIVAIDSEDVSVDELDSQFDLDDELIAELSDSTDDFDVTDTLAESTGRNDTFKFSSTGEFATGENTLDLDDSLLTDLTEDEGDSVATLSSAEIENNLELPDSELEDLTDEISSTSEVEDESELNSLDFSDIDVSDLVSSPSPENPEIQNDADALSPLTEEDIDLDNSSLSEEEDILEPEIEGEADADEKIVFNEIGELDFDDLDENDLATLDETADLDDDSEILDLTPENPFPSGAVADNLSGAVLPLDDEEDEAPPDLPT